MNDQADLIPTGIESLDVLLGGGIPRRQSVIITGDPGSGKTILCSQIAFAQATLGKRVILATLTSEPHDKLVNELRNFSFFRRDQIGEDIFLLSAYPWFLKGPKEARDGLMRVIRDRKASLLFLDGLRSVRDVWQDEAKMREFLYELSVSLSNSDTVGLITTEYPLEKLLEYPEATTVDGIISLSTRPQGERSVRRIQISKLRGRPHLTGKHVMHITNHGIEVTPRLEAVTTPSQTFQPPEERVRFGLPELDKLLHGGLYRQTTTMLVGSTGIGKTLLSLHFAAEGAKVGERSLCITFMETEPRIAQRARRIGLELAPLLESGKLLVKRLSPIELEPDDLTRQVLQLVKSTGASRLVLDGLIHLEDGLKQNRERAQNFLLSFIEQLRQARCTTIFIKEVSKVAGPELDFSDSPVSILAENVIFLRHLELGGALHRMLSILKMHDSSHDSALREFRITNEGIRVMEPIESAEGLLTGVARPIGWQERGGMESA